MKITFVGGLRTVTGSCFHLESGGMQLLVECGMHQGEHADELNRVAFPFAPKEIDCLLLTHAHIDHAGLIPRLVKEGFTGRILATAATADLAEIMLYDSANIQVNDAEWLSRKAQKAGAAITFSPLYTPDEVTAALALFERLPYGKIEHLGGGVKCRFIDAGHILGSATLELWFPAGPPENPPENRGEKKIVFSGDIGKRGNPIVRDPQPAATADYVVMESTYGNRRHRSREESIAELAHAIEETLKRKGIVLIPAFAVGRTQELLYILNAFVREKRFGSLDVYVDSPLAAEATKVYLAHPDHFDDEALKLLRQGAERRLRLHFTASVEESQALNRLRSGAVIIAGSGMCDGGRIRHHLKHHLWRPECSVIFVGFQAKGTLGREIVEGARSVRLFGEEVAVRARIHTIGGFSAHADRQELLEWLGAFSPAPQVFIVHGEEEVSFDFKAAVEERPGLTAQVPFQGQSFEL